MAKRKPITKAIRFEVFKRDKFTCQYCGESAPNVILEIDHIVPVSKGGTNEIINLVTSCRDCNRGKSGKKLDDNSAVMVQKKQMDAMQERREQLEMMVQWRQSLDEEIEIETDAIDAYYRNNTRWGVSEQGRLKIRRLIREFGLNEVYTACEIAVEKYYKGTVCSWQEAFNKVGGICYNRRKKAESGQPTNEQRAATPWAGY